MSASIPSGAKVKATGSQSRACKLLKHDRRTQVLPSPAIQFGQLRVHPQLRRPLLCGCAISRSKEGDRGPEQRRSEGAKLKARFRRQLAMKRFGPASVSRASWRRMGSKRNCTYSPRSSSALECSHSRIAASHHQGAPLVHAFEMRKSELSGMRRIIENDTFADRITVGQVFPPREHFPGI